MGITRKDTLLHWNSFLEIEKELETLSRYVDLSGNDDTYSLEISKIFLNACSEIDIVLKQIGKAIDSTSDLKNIIEYYNKITPVYPGLIQFAVCLPRHELILTPWIDWRQNAPPIWWTHHNKVKHQRHEHFNKATLKNCLNAVAALYVATLHLYKDQAENGELLTIPSILGISQANHAGTKLGRYGITFVYKF